MRWNPVLRKEILTDSRTMRLPVAVAVLNLILISAALFNIFSINADAEASGEIQYASILQIYALISEVEFLMLLVIMPAMTAGMITGEREKRTLPLLQTAPISAGSMIRGKLWAAVMEILVVLVSALPVQATVFIFGGITAMDMAMLYCCYLVTALLIGSIGLWASAICQKTAAANVVSYIATAVLVAGTMFLSWIVWFVNAKRLNLLVGPGVLKAGVGGIYPLMLFNPYVTYDCIINTQTGVENTVSELNILFGYVPDNFLTHHWIGISMLVQLILAGLLLAIAVKRMTPDIRGAKG